jgi:acyl-coenzyme A thioesterase PaaI-like protein
MNIRTHLEAKEDLLGLPLEIKSGEYAKVKLDAIDDMKVDDRGLIHGGFTFGVADYAAMLAVNHPNVVLGVSEVKFTAPVIVGDVMLAFAKIVTKEGRRRTVEVEVIVNGKTVLQGIMTCYILNKHVLEIK